jgi:hypothetical protein
MVAVSAADSPGKRTAAKAGLSTGEQVVAVSAAGARESRWDHRQARDLVVAAVSAGGRCRGHGQAAGKP